MIRPLAAAVAAALAALPLAAAADTQTGAVRAIVYDCASGALVRGAAVTFHPLDGGPPDLRLTSGRDGSVARVGLPQGRYVVTAGPGPGAIPGITAAQRLATLESEDVLVFAIGIRTAASGATPPPAARPRELRSICDPVRIPPAPATSDRYVIR